MPNISLTDESYHLSYSNNYLLLVYIMPNGIVSSVVDTIRKKILSLDFNTSKSSFLDESFSQKSKIKEVNYKSVYVLYHTTNAIIGPQSLMLDDNSSSLMAFASNGENFDTTLNNNIVNNLALQFSLPNEIKTFFEANQQAIFIHSYAPLVWNCIQSCTKEKYFIGIELLNERITICVVFNKQLLLCNYYDCLAESDFVFHILNILNHFELNPFEIPIHLTGMVNKTDKKVIEISRFIKNVKYLKSHHDYLLSYRLNEIPSHWFTLLYDQIYANNQR